MKKMLIALLLALTLLVSAVPSFAEEAPKELKFVYIDGWSSVDDGDTTSAITQKIAEETGVLISPVTAGGDRGTILLSSGEVGDCLMVYNATMLKTCVENDMMLDLSTLVSEEKTPAILSNPDRIQMAQVLSETDDGSYYFLPVQCGSEGAKLVLVYGVGRMCHIAFWEPMMGGEFDSDEEWAKQPYRLGMKLHPLTIEQNAITSFKSRTTLVPCRANTIGPGLFLQADYAIGGCDGTLSRGMQWQGLSFWTTLRYGPDRWVTSSYIPTLPGKLFFDKELAGPLVAECN